MPHIDWFPNGRTAALVGIIYGQKLFCHSYGRLFLNTSGVFGSPQSNKLASTLLWDVTLPWHHVVMAIQPQQNLLSRVLCQSSETRSRWKRERRESGVVNFGGIVTRSQFNSKFLSKWLSCGSCKGEWWHAWSAASFCLVCEVSQSFDLPLERI